jgi:hypothetical protein
MNWNGRKEAQEVGAEISEITTYYNNTFHYLLYKYEFVRSLVHEVLNIQ